MSRRIIPQGSNVLVQQLSREDVTQSGIILPDFDADKRRDYRYGVVLEVGDGYDTASMHQADVTAHAMESGLPSPWTSPIPDQLRPGDRVIVNSYGIERMKMMGRELFLVGKVHVAAKVEEVYCRVCDGTANVGVLMLAGTSDAEARAQLCTMCWANFLIGEHDAQPQEAAAGRG